MANKHRRDCLGRVMREVEAAAPPRRRLLREEEIALIAHEVRTRPLTDVGRHVMPLIQHASEQDDLIHALTEACEAAYDTLEWSPETKPTLDLLAAVLAKVKGQ